MCCVNAESPEAYKEKLREIIKSSKTNPDAYVEDFKVDLPGKTIFRAAYVNGEKKREAQIPIGVETDVTGPDGRPYKVNWLHCYKENFPNTKHLKSVVKFWMWKDA